MRTLDRKLLRNLRAMRGQLLAIVLIIACGVAAFVTVLTAYRGLTSTRDAYYARYRMADLFATVKRAPPGVDARFTLTPPSNVNLSAFDSRFMTIFSHMLRSTNIGPGSGGHSTMNESPAFSNAERNALARSAV